MRILIVEDESLLRLTLKAQLETQSTGPQRQLFVASAFDEAMKILQSESIDVAFLDLNLGDSCKDGGIRLLRHIRQHSPSTVVIITTGVEDSRMVEECLRIGAADYVFKPFDATRVHHILIKAIVQ